LCAWYVRRRKKVKFNDTDEKGNSVVLDLTVKEAVKRMTELEPNLFKSKGPGGLGSNTRDGHTTPSDLASAAKNMSAEEYMKARREGKVHL
jgi:hypothetical protein